jgi:hypothetical protein
MITSLKPWHVKQIETGKSVILLDANGKVVGFIRDWQDAEHIVENTNEGVYIEDLKLEIEELQEEVAGLETRLGEE